MMRADVITLVSEDPSSHGVYETYTPTNTEVFAEVRSVGMRESYEALSIGLHPEIVFSLTNEADYDGQRQVIWNNVTYKVVRTYVSGDGIELTCERMTGDV